MKVKPVALGVGVGMATASEGLMHGVSIKTHRADCHGAVELNPVLDLYCRARLWTTTGQKRRQWVGVHRKHHKFSDMPGDPHSPIVESQGGTRNGDRRVQWMTALMYRKEIAQNPTLIEDYAPDMTKPDKYDKVDKQLFDKGSLGVLGVQPLMLAGALRALGLRGKDLAVGTAVATGTSLFMGLRAGGEVNAKSHRAKKRDPQTNDYSSNLGEGMPGVRGKLTRIIGALTTGGEAPGHKRHHLEPASAVFSAEPELDPAGAYLGVLHEIGLATIHHVNPDLDPNGRFPDAEGNELARLRSITPAHVLSEVPVESVA